MKLKLICFTLLLTSLCLLLEASPVNASAFNPNNLMDDGVFYNTNTINVIQINNFLNSFPKSCISPNSGFSAPDPIGYNPTNGFLYGKNVSGGQVVYDAALAYGLNPQVLLSTLEKEEGLVDGSGLYGCSTTAIASAVGYGCPDGSTLYNYSGVDLYSTGTTFDSNFNVVANGTEVTSINNTCVNSSLKVGFSQQLIHATWLFRFAQERSKGNIGWNVQKTNAPQPGDSWDNSDDPQSCYGGPMTQGTWQRCPSGSTSYYDGYTTIDGTSVHMDTGATAALYWYTPHFSGNKNFDNIFAAWFGGIYSAPYYAGYLSESNSPQLNPGQQASAWFEYQNLGTYTWYDDTSVGSAPLGSYAVHLATNNPLNRGSAFSAGWPSPSRPDVTFSAVYESDGTTLATNQHVAQPGQIVKFSFNLTDPSELTAGTYREYFRPIAEGSTTGLFNDPGTYLDVDVNQSPNVAWAAQSQFPTIAPTDEQSAFITLTNTGNIPLYDDRSIGSAPSGSHPTHLAISCPINSNSDFASNWPAPDRPAVNFSAVYESDGTTLATNQHVAQPGQIVKFSFNMSTPAGYAASTYQVCFQPVLEGTSNGVYANLGIYLNVTVPSISVIKYSQLTPVSIVSGEQKNVTLQLQNVGNLSIAAGATIYTNNGSGYQDSSWSNTTTMASIPTSLAAGATTSSSITLLAPITNTSRSDYLGIQLNDSNGSLIHGSSAVQTVQLATPIYAASYISESAAPVFTYGQVRTEYFEYKNTGNKPWYDDSSVTTTVTRSPLPTHLATAQPLNRASGFASNWPAPDRPAVNFSAVYESDGTTLATNQHVAQPGQIVKFSFNMAAASWVNPSTYREYFQPIIEGTSNGALGFIGTYFDTLLSAPQYSAAYHSESSYPALSKGQSTPSFIEYANTGNASWYDDTSYVSTPANSRLYPVHLSTLNPLNRNSVFGGQWPSPSRPDVTFSAVYESDGTTLATNQHVAQPGQIVKFSFNVSLDAQSQAPSGTYREYFGPVAEGSSSGLFNNPQTYLDITVQ